MLMCVARVWIRALEHLKPETVVVGVVGVDGGGEREEREEREERTFQFGVCRRRYCEMDLI
jgi:hypothetical protein